MQHPSTTYDAGWSVSARAAVFALASSSILSLIVQFYEWVSMRAFTLGVFLPCVAVLTGAVVLDWMRGSARLARNVAIGAVAGLVAAVAYDAFRVPFVFARAWGIDGWVPAMDLFKVFAMFGAMILGRSPEVTPFPPGTHIAGWLYHFSNGAAFGVMYVALIGDGSKRHWLWAAAFAVVIELGMLFTPYPSVFAIAVDGVFVAVTLTAHLVFGVVLGIVVRRLSGMVRRPQFGVSDR